MGNMANLPLASLAAVNNERSLRGWLRYELRPVFPHQCCVLSVAMSGENGVESRLIAVDFPAAALRSILSAGGGIDTPVVRRWLQQRTPQRFDADRPWAGICEAWLGKFRHFGMCNTAAHGDYDEARGCTCYFSAGYRGPRSWAGLAGAATAVGGDAATSAASGSPTSRRAGRLDRAGTANWPLGGAGQNATGKSPQSSASVKTPSRPMSPTCYASRG